MGDKALWNALNGIYSFKLDVNKKHENSNNLCMTALIFILVFSKHGESHNTYVLVKYGISKIFLKSFLLRVIRILNSVTFCACIQYTKPPKESDR